jgi:hypothetical protein
VAVQFRNLLVDGTKVQVGVEAESCTLFVSYRGPFGTKSTVDSFCGERMLEFKAKTVSERFCSVEGTDEESVMDVSVRDEINATVL